MRIPRQHRIRLAVSWVLLLVHLAAGDARALDPGFSTYRDRIQDEHGITILDAGKLDEGTQLRAVYHALQAFPKSSLPARSCDTGWQCLNTIRVRDLLVGTSADGYSPYKLTTLSLVEQWWRTVMLPQGYDGPNIFYDFSTIRDQFVRDGFDAQSNNFLAVVFHELMHGVDSKLYERDWRYRGWRHAIVERMSEQPWSYLRTEVLVEQGEEYVVKNPNELVPGLMNAWQQDTNAMLSYCLRREDAEDGMLVVSQCLAMLDVLGVPAYGQGRESRGIGTDAQANVVTFAVPVSRDPVSKYVDGFVFAGVWHRYAVNEAGLATAKLTLKCGDTNGDGFTMEDYLHISRAAKGERICTHEICDVNRDGVVTRKDAANVRRAIKPRGAPPCRR